MWDAHVWKRWSLIPRRRGFLEGWWSVLAYLLVAVKSDSWCTDCTLDSRRFRLRMIGMLHALSAPCVFPLRLHVPLFLKFTTGFSHWWAPAVSVWGLLLPWLMADPPPPSTHTPLEFPFFHDCTAAATSFRRMGWLYCVFVLGQFSTDGSPLALCFYSSEQYSVHRFSIFRSSARHFLGPCRIVVAFPCFTPAVWSCGRRNEKSHLVGTQSLNFLPLKPWVGQYIAIHAALTAMDFFLAYFYPSGPFTNRLFSKTSPDFSCVGWG